MRCSARWDDEYDDKISTYVNYDYNYYDDNVDNYNFHHVNDDHNHNFLVDFKFNHNDYHNNDNVVYNYKPMRQ